MTWPWNRREISQVWMWPHIFWLNIFGWWAEEAGSLRMKKILSFYRAILMLYFSTITCMMLVATGIRFVQGSILDNMFTLFASCLGFVGIIKVYCLILFRKPLKSAMDNIDELLLDVKDGTEERLIRQKLKNSWIIFTVYLTIGSCISMHWVCRPVINAIFYGEMSRIVDTWPIFIDTWPQFFISFFYQLPFILGVGHAVYFFDNLYFCISECILCLLAILNYRLSNMRLEGNDDVSADLIHSIKYFDKLLRACRSLRDSSSALIVFQSLITVTILCSGVFIVTMSYQTDVNVLMNLGEGAVVVIFVIYFYCWYSTEITYQCQNVCNAAYMSDWINGSEKSKKNLLILMRRTTQPIVFGGIMKINLQTCITVLKATFSYYNFLIACVEKNKDSN